MKTCIQALSILAIASTLSFAQEGKPAAPRQRPNPAEMFKKLDKDGNGTVSLAEFKASPRGQKDEAKAEEVFKKIDADHNGEATPEEFKANRPQHGPRKGGKRPKPPEGGPTPPPAPPAGE